VSRATRLPPAKLKVEKFRADRTRLLPLFALADDSAEQIRSYIDLGEVLVARFGKEIAGHLQILITGPNWEIRSLAVMAEWQKRGIGSLLLTTAIGEAFRCGIPRVLVATATADLDNISFYQNRGFRIDYVEHDVFTADRGYPELEANGIPVRDRVWLSLVIT
jgi:GNAT superfamily N-acetyltransferase